MTADEILAIPADQPERLFSGPDKLKLEYRQLAKAWHPDSNKDPAASDVAARINALFAEAQKKAAIGRWDTPNQMVLKDAWTGKTFKIGFRRKIPFELGEMLYGRTKVLFLIRSEFKDLFEAAHATIEDFKFGSDRMRAEMTKYLPVFRNRFETKDGLCAYFMDKTEDVFLLRDVQTHFGGRMDPRHVAWIMSALLNIACYLEYAKITHNGITADTVFISPKYHSALLFGGWWYSTKVGHKIAALPDGTRRLAPPDMLRHKKGDPTLDLVSIRAIGRDLLGDITGMTLLSTLAPAPMVNFLRSHPSSSARQDYAHWGKVLEASFGPRRFTELVITENDIFKGV